MSAVLPDPAPPRWTPRRRWWTVGALLLAAILALGGWAWQWRQAGTPPTYTTQAVTRGDLTLRVTANGTLQPTRSITIGSELSGTVRRVEVDVNDSVHQGQVLLQLDTAKQEDQIRRTQAALSAANARVAQTHATVLESQAALARLEDVARRSGGQVPAQAELDRGRATLARAWADSDSALAGVRDAKAALSTDRITLSKAAIRAPADGVVLTRNVDPGNAVAASLQAVTLFTVAEDLHKLRLSVYVDEADVGTVQVGQEASFTVSAYPSRRYPARATRVGFGSTITDNVVTYLTLLEVDNLDLSLRPGMTATALITAAQRHDVLLVPNSALRFSPTEAKGAPRPNSPVSLLPRMPNSSTRQSAATTASTAGAKQVWVLADDGSGMPLPLAVTPGISDGRMTEIVAGTLKVGMQVITQQKTAAP